MYLGNQIFNLFYYFFTIYTITVFILYISITVVSLVGIKQYFNKTSFVKYTSVLSSPFAPSISILSPLYNEERNAISSIRSLLTNHYVNYDIVIINDGSSDKTLELIIEAFQLKKVEYTFEQKIKTENILGIYKSTNPAYEKIKLINKERGGKSDALNAGLNISENEYVVCVDGDCILADDALQKMIKPFLEHTEKEVVACGGVIRIANGCKIKDGRVIEKKLHHSILVKFQVLEYLRSFLLARVGWSKNRGLMHIAGAFCIFTREKAIAVKGFNRYTLGEDMDIVVKIQKFMYDAKLKFKTIYLPEPLCWTEVPSTCQSLIRQRSRWARGTIKTLWDHKKMMLNPKYGQMGMFGYPVWFIYERFGPIIEIIGISFFIVSAYLGRVNWMYTTSFLIATYLFAIMYSLFALLTEEMTYHQYDKKGDLTKLILIALIEPFTYHIFMIYPVILGNIQQLFKLKNKWGDIDRKGFQSYKPKTII